VSIAARGQENWRSRAVVIGRPGGAGALRVGRKSVSGVVSLLGAALILGAIWGAASAMQRELPGPLATSDTIWRLVSDPFYSNGPNDKGIGLQLWASIQRVFIGFGMGTAIAIPLGIVLGGNAVARRFFDPVVQVLRPVSPLAWFPIGMVALQSTPDAGVFVVAITSLWATVINTAQGVGSIPQAHRDVARVFRFNRWKYLTRIVIPHSMPYIVTGLRLSMGTAWMVIVAAEMLAGSTGIGFFVWDSYNALNIEQILAAILFIGVVGLVLDRGFGLLAARFAYTEVS
jgi:nitrate/nitrite transport system permease protein